MQGLAEYFGRVWHNPYLGVAIAFPAAVAIIALFWHETMLVLLMGLVALFCVREALDILGEEADEEQYPARNPRPLPLELEALAADRPKRHVYLRAYLRRRPYVAMASIGGCVAAAFGVWAVTVLGLTLLPYVLLAAGLVIHLRRLLKRPFLRR